MASVEMSSNVGAELDVISDVKTAVTGQLVGVELHLGKVSKLVDRNTPLAALAADEADYDGYAAAAVTFGAAGLDAAGRAGVYGTHAAMVPTGSVTPNQVYYAWLENGAGLLLDAWVVNGTTGIPMAGVTNFYLCIPFYRPSLSGSVEQSW